jgi:hypothetical protein
MSSRGRPSHDAGGALCGSVVADGGNMRLGIIVVGLLDLAVMDLVVHFISDGILSITKKARYVVIYVKLEWSGKK